MLITALYHRDILVFRGIIALVLRRANDETLFEMCFKAIGPNGSSSTVCMTDSLVPIDMYNSANVLLGVNKACGTVRIGNAMTIQMVK